MEFQIVPNETVAHKINWLPAVSLVSGILSICPFILLMTMPNWLQYKTHGFQEVVELTVGIYISLGGLIFGLPSVIIGSIALIRISKGERKRSQIFIFSMAIIMGTLGILLSIYFIVILVDILLHGIP